MRHFLYVLTAVLLVSFVHTSLAQTTTPCKRALLIGVNDYLNLPDLKNSVNDAKTLEKALLGIGFEEDNIQILITDSSLNKRPTKKRIETAISNLVSCAQPNDIVLIAFSGQGFQIGKDFYLCPIDADMDSFNETCISVSKIAEDLAKCQAKYKLIVTDACRRNPTNPEKDMKNIPIPPAGVTLFMSCSQGEVAYEETCNNGNGYFTKNFAEALSGKADSDHDGKLTLMEVCTWTMFRTKEEVQEKENKKQTPVLQGSFSDFILIRN